VYTQFDIYFYIAITGGLIVPEGIILLVVSVSFGTGMVYYIYFLIIEIDSS
jgi:CRISPR/Cas system-associated protein Csm6